MFEVWVNGCFMGVYATYTEAYDLMVELNESLASLAA